MNHKDAIELLDNTANLCRDIGAKGCAEQLREVAKYIEHLQYDAKVKADHHAKVLENIQIRNKEYESRIAELEAEIQFRAAEDAGSDL